MSTTTGPDPDELRRALRPGVAALTGEATRLRKAAARYGAQAARRGGNLSDVQRRHAIAELEAAAESIGRATETLRRQA